MTSKEALENIKSRINSLSLFPKVDRKTYDESWEIIEKDLEVLELLKNLPFRIYQYYDSERWYINTSHSLGLYETEKIKIEEWLKRENLEREVVKEWLRNE